MCSKHTLLTGTENIISDFLKIALTLRKFRKEVPRRDRKRRRGGCPVKSSLRQGTCFGEPSPWSHGNSYGLRPAKVWRVATWNVSDVENRN